jgi:hypothetical protein
MAWARVHTPSLSNTFEMWLRTVFSLMWSRSPISALASPSVISSSTARSRADSPAKAACSPAGAGATPVKSSTACWKRAHAGSSSSRTWFRESSSTNCAPGIPAASRRPSANGATASWRAWRTRVGTRIWASRSVTSMDARARISSPARAGDVVLRHRSLNHAICSGVASGTKREVNTWRKAGLSRPQPALASSMIARYSRSPASLPRRSTPRA